MRWIFPDPQFPGIFPAVLVGSAFDPGGAIVRARDVRVDQHLSPDHLDHHDNHNDVGSRRPGP
jgi:hypothetical protein